MERRAHVVGVGMVPFATPSRSESYDVLAEGAVRAALADAGLGFGLLKGPAIHGEQTVRKPGGGYQTLANQVGEVTSVSKSSIAVKSEDGYARTYTVDDTRFDVDTAGQLKLKANASIDYETEPQVTIVRDISLKPRQAFVRTTSGEGARQVEPEARPRPAEGSIRAPWPPSSTRPGRR